MSLYAGVEVAFVKFPRLLFWPISVQNVGLGLFDKLVVYSIKLNQSLCEARLVHGLAIPGLLSATNEDSLNNLAHTTA